MRGEAPPNPEPRAHSVGMPALACDAHCHIYGPFSRFPLPPDRSFTPLEAPETALRRLQERLGFGRAVIVQSRGHGFDHGPVLEALRTGGGRYRGVALVRGETTDAEIAEMAAAGFCGARFNFLPHLGGAPAPETLRAVVDRVRPYGWHVAVHVEKRGLVEHEALIRGIGVPVVIDHMGRPEFGDEAAVAALFRLLDTGRVHVKLSGVDRISRTGAPYADAVGLAARVAAHAPARVLWGTDWPHVNLQGPMPDDGELVGLVAAIAPTEAGRRLMLVDNPARFFGFGD